MEKYITYKEQRLEGRHVKLSNIEPLLKELALDYKLEIKGWSEKGRPIYFLKVGTGKKKILLWSQMHGNESTTTRALFDLLNTIKNSSETIVTQILESCTLYIFPMLNPDGAEVYTRINGNEVDLNRDAQNCSQCEMQVFIKTLRELQPDLALNLHGQRTIFSAGQTNNIATVSFLSAAGDLERSITPSRRVAMKLIAQMNDTLQHLIPNSVGRYDDSFNLNCTGDTIEDMGIPGILFEAGHYENDYEREKVRYYIYRSLLTCLSHFAIHGNSTDGYEKYFDIPENGKCFNDIIIRNITIQGEIKDIALQYEEKLIEGELCFIPKVFSIQPNIAEFGHLEIDAKHEKVSFDVHCNDLIIDNKIGFIQINDEKFSVFPIYR